MFAYRLQVPQTSANDMSTVADAIEAVEALGWQLDRMEPDSFVGKGALAPNVSWMLVFRSML
ncbi:hypothetical protein OHS33_28175 [Streptomyces sp. NBC_00536]|uniref:hypothetical protein n=1 Tax=Streptomyces sp. NBC_00536 TaxID=2975769 RepID=UPI002E7FDBB2|nr:hypothetical protein [Streptomyces sp. NBC_00536]WUC81880.1 hypothetical protein OHS33_28175 [Streptomyces sp. NBC_00536]